MVRAYAPDRPVPTELLDRVCAAALRVPSAGFTQGVSLLVLTGAEQCGSYWDTAGDVPAEPVDGPSGEGRPPGRWLDGPRSRALVGALLVRGRRDGRAGHASGRHRCRSGRLLLRRPGGEDRCGPRRLRGPGRAAQCRRGEPGLRG